jgi:hypothetical protein
MSQLAGTAALVRLALLAEQAATRQGNRPWLSSTSPRPWQLQYRGVAIS